MIKVRQMSAVLLRRIFSSSVDFYDKLDQAFQQEMKNDLLKAINEEQAQAVRKKVCDAVAELSRSLLGKLWRYLLFYRNLIIQTNFFLVERVCLRTDADCTFVFIKNLIFFSTVALSHLKGPPIFSCQVPAINVYCYHTSKSFILHLTQILFSLFSDEEGYNHWQELLKFLFECCNSQHSELKECALHIFV